MSNHRDLESDAAAAASESGVDSCGTPGFSLCLLNQLASGMDLSDAARCAVCGKTVEDLDRQVVSMGSHLRLDSPSAKMDAACLQWIEHGILWDSRRSEPRPSDSSLHSPPSSPPPPLEIGPYEIGAQVGRGGMGAVYRATHKHLRKDVAIKLLPITAIGNARAIARFEREMEAVGKLDHPNVVRAMDAGKADGNSFLIMELVSGVDLACLVANGRSLTTADACELVRQAATGLHYAHSRGLIHRDVKPANLMLAEDATGRPLVKVMDLGLALWTENGSMLQLTDQGQLMGTLEFIAPEQATPTTPVDHRADIYAMGATLFRLLTGEVPFHGELHNTPVKRLYGLLNHATPSPAILRKDLPDPLVDLVDRMLSRDPDARPQSMQEVADSLRPFASGHDLAALCQEAKVLSDLQTAASCDRSLAADSIPQVLGGVSDDTVPTGGPTFVSGIFEERAAAAAVRDAGSLPAKAGRDPEAGVQKRVPPQKIRKWIAAAVLLPCGLMSGILWLKTTDGGYVRIDADPSINVSVNVVQDGEPRDPIAIGRDGNQFWYRSGDYQILLPEEANGQLTIEGNKFTLRRGEDHVITISRVTAAERCRRSRITNVRLRRPPP